MPKASLGARVILMANLQVKDLPEPLHSELRRRAHLAGVTVRSYVLDLIERDQAVPAKAEWMERVRRLPAIDLRTPVSDLVAADRAERSGT